jgi:hypothetical protein
MRARHILRGAIGVGAGLALAVAVAIAPASAAPVSTAKPAPAAPVAPSNSCATFEGLTATGPGVSYSGVALQAGESITASVSPTTTYDILLSATIGLNFFFYAAPSATGLTFTAPASSVYTLSWSLQTNGGTAPALTWTFDCSTATGASGGVIAPADADKDGVADSVDFCSGTVLPDAVSRPAAGSYYANRSGLFVDGNLASSGITIADAGGCSAAQIAKAVNLNKNVAKAGVPLATLQSWAASH